MSLSRKLFIGMNLASVLFTANIGHATTTQNTLTAPQLSPWNQNRSYFYISALYVKPDSDNLKYGTFVWGIQPYKQSWHYLATDPIYHPAFELGFNYAICNTPYSTGLFWTHINSNDSSHQQAAQGTDVTTVQFVAPPFEMSPPVFGIKSVNNKVNFAFDNILLNASRLFEIGSHVKARVFGGLSILNLNQTIETTFGDYAGATATPYSYPLPPDPLFSFQLKNVSKYLGIGPDVGLSVNYKTSSGFGLLGEFMGSLTTGRIRTRDIFTSTSTRLVNQGIGISQQQITAPNATQIVVGADSKLGVFYSYDKLRYANFTVELGYRMATFLNAISMVAPNTLVQPGTVVVTPEFSTGTMAIVSTNATLHPFSFSGPFLNAKIDIA
jgi:hypothetical protein